MLALYVACFLPLDMNMCYAWILSGHTKNNFSEQCIQTHSMYYLSTRIRCSYTAIGWPIVQYVWCTPSNFNICLKHGKLDAADIRLRLQHTNHINTRCNTAPAFPTKYKYIYAKAQHDTLNMCVRVCCEVSDDRKLVYAIYAIRATMSDARRVFRISSEFVIPCSQTNLKRHKASYYVIDLYFEEGNIVLILVVS